MLLDAFVALTDDYAAAVPAGMNALARLRSDTNPTGETLRWLWQGCVLALELWDDESAYVLSERHLQVARKTGALTELPLALGSHTPILVFCGEIAEAPYGALILYAWQGQAREARELIEATMREATSRAEGVGVAICEYSHAVLCNGLGEYDEALTAAQGACADPTEMVAHNWSLAELIEPAARAGRPDLAADALDRLTRKAQACRTDWALGIEARSRALPSTNAAEPRFRDAIEHLGRARVRTELSLAYGMFTALGVSSRRQLPADAGHGPG